MTTSRERAKRTFERCWKAFQKLQAMHYKHVRYDWQAWCLGRRIMRAVRRVRARARAAYTQAQQDMLWL